MQALQSLRRPLAASLVVALLAACQPMTGVIPDGARGAEARAERYARSGDHQDAARAYEEAATADPARANPLLLAAAREWLAAGNPGGSEAALARMSAPLSAADARERARLGAESSLARNQPARALEQLATLSGPDDAATLATRARALFALGNVEDAVRTLVAREGRLAGTAERAANQQLIMAGVAAAAERGALPVGPAEEPVVAGWIELAQIEHAARQSPVGAAGRLQAWRLRYPAHPANAALWPQLAERYSSGFAPSSRVALLLPLSGRARAAGQAVRDGFLSAYYQQPQGMRPVLRLYDVAASDAPSAYLGAISDGAQLVVGPLTREEVGKLAEIADGSATTLALNFLPDGTMTPDRFFQFALSPEDEARTAARRAVADGRKDGLALVPANEWGQRVLAAFEEELARAGGRLLARSVYAAGTTDFQVILDGLLELRTVPAEAGRSAKVYRPDAQFMFVAAQPVTGRLIRTQLRFNYASKLPVYATSDVHEPGSRGNIDLDGVMFPEMPWVLDETGVAASLRTTAERSWMQRAPSRSRLFAFGYDAFAIVSELSRHRSPFEQPVPGVTGTLELDAYGRIRRSMDFAVIEDGRAVPLPPAGSIATP